MKIVYTSNTGFTKQYAEVLGEKTGLEVISFEDAITKLSKKDDVIYLGWLMAGGIKNCKKALNRFNVKAVCAVGLATDGVRDSEIRKANALPENIALFTLQGGYAPEKLRGVNKFMMKIVTKSLAKNLSAKENRTEEENLLLDMLLHGGNAVSEEKLSPVINYCLSNP